MEAPLIVTLKLDAGSQLFFNELRKTHFPRHINYLEAHCTLFHKLPADNELVNEILSGAALRPVMPLLVSDIRSIGNGVVYTLQSTTLQVLHKFLQKAFDAMLISQDRQILQPHITIQNKVTANKAATLLQALQPSFAPFEISATGLTTWRYLKGPWEHVRDFNFQDKGL